MNKISLQQIQDAEFDGSLLMAEESSEGIHWIEKKNPFYKLNEEIVSRTIVNY